MPDTRPHIPEADISSVRINPDEWNEIYVIGDVHGCRETLDRLLAVIDPGDEDLIVFVGDLVRKGPDSKGVVDTVRERKNFLSVRGNNEQKIIDGHDDIPDLTANDLSFLESLPVLIAWGDSLVVQGGVDPRKPLSEHSESELLTMRSLVSGGSYDRPYWFETRRESPRVFFGHTVLSEPFATDWAVGLDTGCVHGGQLTAYQSSTGEFVTADPLTTHIERSPRTIVDPELCDPVP
jgi:serine/threonine protein phosphatase 1